MEMHVGASGGRRTGTGAAPRSGAHAGIAYDDTVY